MRNAPSAGIQACIPTTTATARHVAQLDIEQGVAPRDDEGCEAAHEEQQGQQKQAQWTEDFHTVSGAMAGALDAGVDSQRMDTDAGPRTSDMRPGLGQTAGALAPLWP